MITLEKLTKIFGTRPAVESLDLTVPKGEIFGLLGHNGAGKSTTIGMLLGQVWPTSGSVLVCGHDVTRNRHDALRKVGAIFETPIFYDYLSGRRNLEILATYTAPTSAQRIREVAEWVGLGGREDSKVRTYSHGMRARLALAQALLPGPELLILDEPTNGLDPEGIHEMRETIRRLHRNLGLTILLSSHLLSEVEQLCSRIAVIHGGRKVFDGTLAETRASAPKLLLDVDRFAEAAALLLAEGWITGSDPTGHVLLAPGRNVSGIVRRLVEAGFNVEGAQREPQTLEDFYLSVVKSARLSQGTPSAPPPIAASIRPS
jgi:ABC-2 type transport system ATP-binding protein